MVFMLQCDQNGQSTAPPVKLLSHTSGNPGFPWCVCKGEGGTECKQDGIDEMIPGVSTLGNWEENH